MKISTLILEKRNRPKLVVMAGGAGTGKSYLLNQLDLGSLHQVNPDKYVEDPNSPAYNKLSPGVALANKEAEALSDEKTSFVWDTTASNPDKIQMFLKKGYDVYMVMVYTHPMIAYIANFSRNRNVPRSAVFSTWRNVYDLIDNYNKMLKVTYLYLLIQDQESLKRRFKHLMQQLKMVQQVYQTILKDTIKQTIPVNLLSDKSMKCLIKKNKSSTMQSKI